MQTPYRFFATLTLGLLSALLVLTPPQTKAKSPPGLITPVKPYAVSISPEYVAIPILSVGDLVPYTSDPSKQFQMIGIPDGLGAYRINDRKTAIYLNHEVAGTAISLSLIHI